VAERRGAPTRERAHAHRRPVSASSRRRPCRLTPCRRRGVGLRRGVGRWVVTDRRGIHLPRYCEREGVGGGGWPTVVAPPRESKHEGRRRWVVADCRGTPTRERARGAAEVGGGRMSWYTPHAIASARGGGGRRPNVMAHPPRDCEREGRRWVVAECHGTPPHAIARARGVVSGGRTS
jgi:hypothetical protein